MTDNAPLVAELRELLAEDEAARDEGQKRGVMPTYHGRSVTAEARLLRGVRAALPTLLDALTNGAENLIERVQAAIRKRERNDPSNSYNLAFDRGLHAAEAIVLRTLTNSAGLITGEPEHPLSSGQLATAGGDHAPRPASRDGSGTGLIEPLASLRSRLHKQEDIDELNALERLLNSAGSEGEGCPTCGFVMRPIQRSPTFTLEDDTPTTPSGSGTDTWRVSVAMLDGRGRRITRTHTTEAKDEAEAREIGRRTFEGEGTIIQASAKPYSPPQIISGSGTDEEVERVGRALAGRLSDFGITLEPSVLRSAARAALSARSGEVYPQCRICGEPSPYGDPCETCVEIERILTMPDEEILKQATDKELGWAEGMKEGIKVAVRISKEMEALRKALIDCAAHLNAAISLLDRAPATVAPSKKMFEQMKKDYRASLRRARAALKEAGR